LRTVRSAAPGPLVEGVPIPDFDLSARIGFEVEVREACKPVRQRNAHSTAKVNCRSTNGAYAPSRNFNTFLCRSFIDGQLGRHQGSKAHDDPKILSQGPSPLIQR
jgi:hypothetical protein